MQNTDLSTPAANEHPLVAAYHEIDALVAKVLQNRVSQNTPEVDRWYKQICHHKQEADAAAKQQTGPSFVQILQSANISSKSFLETLRFFENKIAVDYRFFAMSYALIKDDIQQGRGVAQQNGATGITDKEIRAYLQAEPSLGFYKQLARFAVQAQDNTHFAGAFSLVVRVLKMFKKENKTFAQYQACWFTPFSSKTQLWRDLLYVWLWQATDEERAQALTTLNITQEQLTQNPALWGDKAYDLISNNRQREVRLEDIFLLLQKKLLTQAS